MQAGSEPPQRFGAHLRGEAARRAHTRGGAGAGAGCTASAGARARTGAAGGARRGRPRATAALDAEDGQWTMPAKSYSARYSQLDRDHADEREGPAAGVDVLDGRAARPRGGADRREQHDVRRHAVPEHALRARPHEARRAEEVEVRAEAAAGGAGRGLLRRRESRRRRTPTARSSSTRSTTTSSRSMRTTGKEVWKTKVGDINIGETMTMAPLVVKGKVLVGNSGGEMGVRGWLKALDLAQRQGAVDGVQHGPRQRRADRPALQALLPEGSRQGPRRDDVAGRAVEDRRRHRVGLALVRSAARTSSTTARRTRARGIPDQRPGDNKWTSTLFARDPDTGEAVWAYQMSPHDLHDYDGVNEIAADRRAVEGADAQGARCTPIATATST